MLAEPRTGPTEAGRLRDHALLARDDAERLSRVFEQSGFELVETFFTENLETHCLPQNLVGPSRIFNLRVTDLRLRCTYNVHIKGLDVEIIRQNKIAERLHAAFGYNPTRSVA